MRYCVGYVFCRGFVEVHSAYASLQGLKLVLLTLGGFPDRRLRAPHDLLGRRGGSGIERLFADETG